MIYRLQFVFTPAKKLARKYLTTRRKKKWSQVQFDSVDWEHLDLALKSKEDMYRIWRSKQNSGFCGTRVQVGSYSGESLPDKRCPNCGRQETAAHLMLCPDESRTRLLAETVEGMAKWMSKDKITDPEIRYWIPKYILMKGSKPLAEMGCMSPQFKALAISQDIIGWRKFTEGHISSFFTRFNASILQCQAVISTGRIGQSNSSPKYCISHTPSGYLGTYPSTTERMAIYETKWQTSCSST